MGKFSLENKIKDRLQGHEVHVDKRELWKSLGIEEEKNRKAIWFWWIAGLVGIIVIGAMYWSLKKDSLETSRMQDARLVVVEKNIAKTGNETLSEISSSERLSKIINDVTSGESVSHNLSQGDPIILDQKKNQSITKLNKLRASNIPLDDNKNFDEVESSNELNPNISNEKTEKNTVNQPLEKPASELYFSKLPIRNATLTFNREIEPLLKSVDLLIKPLQASGKFEIELFAGVGSVSRSLRSTTDYIENYLLARDTAETGLEQISLGFSMKYIIGGGFYGKAGLTMNRWNEKYTYNIITDTIKALVEVPDVIIFDLEGNSSTVYAEKMSTVYNTTNWTRYNRLTQIDIPVTLGYEYRISRWSMFGEVSAIVNMQQNFKGYLYTSESVATKDPEIFKSRIGVNFGANVGLGYGFTPQIRGRLSANYYRSRGSVLFSESGIEQKYSSIGLRFGIGYLF